jgi:acyl carrier protein
MSRDELFQKMKYTLSNTFEIAPEKITPQAQMYTELGLDSIDAVDLLVKMKPYLSGTIEPSQFKDARTLNDVMDILYPLLKK